MEGSEPQSTTPGHIAAAVYEIRKSRTVVLRIYGISENNIRTKIISKLGTYRTR
jgi:hypothetical protein